MVAGPAIGSFVPAASTITAGSGTTLTGTFSGGTGSVDNSVGAIATTVAGRDPYQHHDLYPDGDERRDGFRRCRHHRPSHRHGGCRSDGWYLHQQCDPAGRRDQHHRDATFTGGTAVLGTTPGGSDISSSATSGTPIGVQASGFTATATYYLTVTNAASPVAMATANVTGTLTAVSVGAVTPATPIMTVNGTTTFSSSVSGAANTGISWSATAGTIIPLTGAFTAPASPTSVAGAVTTLAGGSGATWDGSGYLDGQGTAAAFAPRPEWRWTPPAMSMWRTPRTI